MKTTVTLRNKALADQFPSYQRGPDNINSHVPGEYVSNIYLWSPAGSKVIGGKSESGLVLNGFSTVVFAQHSTSTPFSTYPPLVVVGGTFVLHLVPQPTLNPATVSVSVHGVGWAVSGPTGSFSLIRPTPWSTHSSPTRNCERIYVVRRAHSPRGTVQPSSYWSICANDEGGLSDRSKSSCYSRCLGPCIRDDDWRRHHLGWRDKVPTAAPAPWPSLWSCRWFPQRRLHRTDKYHWFWLSRPAVNC
jgi:hypothetical protein